MIKEYKIRINNNEYNVEIEEKITQKEELTFEKFEKEWENIANRIFMKKYCAIIWIIFIYFISFLITYIRKNGVCRIFKHLSLFSKNPKPMIEIIISDIFLSKTLLGIIIILTILFVQIYWNCCIPNKLNKIANFTLNKKLIEESKKEIKLINRLGIINGSYNINDKTSNFFKLLINEKFIIISEGEYKKMLERFNKKIDDINNKTNNIIGYIRNNIIKSFGWAMFWVHVNAFISAYYSDVKNLSYDKFLRNISLYLVMIGLLYMVNYFLMDYYKPTIREIKKKINCLEFIRENK